MGRLFPAWVPPLMTVIAGTGSVVALLPTRSAICLYSGTCTENRQTTIRICATATGSFFPKTQIRKISDTSFSAAPALQAAIDTASIAFAPTSVCRT
jgi:hypothetical protein